MRVVPLQSCAFVALLLVAVANNVSARPQQGDDDLGVPGDMFDVSDDVTAVFQC